MPIDIVDKLRCYFRLIALVIGWLYCARFLGSIFYESSLLLAGLELLCVLCAAFFALKNIEIYPFLLAASLPVLSYASNGLGLNNPYLPCFAFSAFFIFWLPVHIASKKYEKTHPMGYVALLIALCSSISSLSLFSNYPLSSHFIESLLAPATPLTSPFHSLSSSFIIICGALFFYYCSTLPSRLYKSYSHFVVVIFTVLLIAFSISSFFVPFIEKTHFIFLPFEDRSSYGSVVAALFAYHLVLVFSTRGRKRMVYLSTCVVLAALTIMSFSRTSLLLVFVLGVPLTAFQTKKFTLAGCYVALLGLALSTAFALSPHLPHISDTLVAKTGSATVGKLFERTLEPFWPDEGDAQPSYVPTTVLSRVQVWQAAMNAFAENPFMGMGVGTFYRDGHHYSSLESTKGVHPENVHNYFLQVLAEQGLLGEIPLLVFLCGLVAIGRRGPNQGSSTLHAALGTVALVYVISWVPGHPMLLPVQQFFFYFIAAAFLKTSEPVADTIRQRPMYPLYLLILCLALALGWGRSPSDLRYDFGFYPGGKLAWTRDWARFKVRPTGSNMKLSLTARKYNISKDGLFVDILINGKQVERFAFKAPSTRHLSIKIPPGGGVATIDIKVSQTYDSSAVAGTHETTQLGPRRHYGVGVSRNIEFF